MQECGIGLFVSLGECMDADIQQIVETILYRLSTKGNITISPLIVFLLIPLDLIISVQ